MTCKLKSVETRYRYTNPELADFLNEGASLLFSELRNSGNFAEVDGELFIKNNKAADQISLINSQYTDDVITVRDSKVFVDILPAKESFYNIESFDQFYNLIDTPTNLGNRVLQALSPITKISKGARFLKVSKEKLRDFLRFANIPYGAITVGQNKEVFVNNRVVERQKEHFYNLKRKDILSFFMDKFGLTSSDVVFVSKEKFRTLFPDKYNNVQSAIIDGKMYILNGADNKVLTEELLHYLVFTIFKHNPTLFNNLYNQIAEESPQLVTEVSQAYDRANLDQIKNEVVTKALLELFVDEFNGNSDYTNSNIIKQVINFIKKLLSDYVSERFNTNLKVQDLDILSSLESLSNLLNTDIRIPVDTNVEFDLFALDSLHEKEIEKTIKELPLDHIEKLQTSEVFIVKNTIHKNGRDHTVRTSDNWYQVNNVGVVTLEEALKVTSLSEENFLKALVHSNNVDQEAWLRGEIKLAFYRVSEIQEDINVNETSDILKAFKKRKAELLKTRFNLYSKRKANKDNPELIEKINEEIQLVNSQLSTLDSPEDFVIYLVEYFKEDLNRITKNIDNVSIEDFKHIQNTILGWLSFLENFNFEGEELKTINNLRQKSRNTLNNLKTNWIKAWGAEVKNRTGVDILNADGTLATTEDETLFNAFLNPAGQNTNPMSQMVQDKVYQALVEEEALLTKYKLESERIIKDFQKFNKGKDVNTWYDFMLDVDSDGKRTQHIVDETTAEWKKLLESRIKNLTRYHFLLFSNSEVTWNQEVVSKIREEIIEKTKERGFNIDNSFHAKILQKTIGVGANIDETTEEGRKNLEFLVEEILSVTLSNFDYTYNADVFNQVAKKLRAGVKLNTEEASWWINFTSPNNFYLKRKINGVGVFTAKVDNPKYLDSKYKRIQEMSLDDPRRKFYEFYRKNMTENKAALNGTSVFISDTTFIPGFEPTATEASNSAIERFKIKASRYFYDSLYSKLSENYHGRDPMTGEIIMKLNVFSLNMKDAENVSYDLINVMNKFNKEISHFISYSEIENEVLSLLELVRLQETYVKNPDGSPKIVNGVYDVSPETSNNYKQLRDYITSTVYSNYYNIQGSSEVGSGLSPEDNKKIKNYLKQMEASPIPAKRKEELIPYITGTDLDESLLPDEIAYIEIGRKIQVIKSNRKYITGKNAFNFARKLTGLSVLGFNFISPIYEFVQTLTTLFVEAGANVYLNNKDLKFAFKTLKSSLIRTSKDYEKNRRLSLYYNTDGNLDPDIESDPIMKTAFVGYQAVKTAGNRLYLFAVLNHIKVNGIPLHELIDFTGTSPRIKNQYLTKVSEKEFQDALNQSRTKFKEIVATTKDRDMKTNATQLDRNGWGRLVGQFKSSWMIPGWNRRFGKEKDNLTLGTKTKGYYRTVFQGFVNKKKIVTPLGLEETTHFDIIGGLKRMVAFSLIGKKEAASVFEEADISEVDAANYKRAMREVSMLITIWGAYYLLQYLKPEDDEDEPLTSAIFNFNINLLARANRDLTTFIDPDSWKSTVRNFIPAIEVAGEWIDIAGATKDAMVGDLYIYEGTSRERLKLAKEVEQAVPIVNQVRRAAKKFSDEVRYTY